MAYIDRDKAIAYVEEQYRLFKDDEGKQAIVEGCVEALKFTPTADVVEVKHGYFKRNERNIPKMKEFHEKGYALSMNEKSIFYTCSCCGSWCSLSQNYCSECGARMDGTPKERGEEK